jgi:hypothetical protein
MCLFFIVVTRPRGEGRGRPEDQLCLLRSLPPASSHHSSVYLLFVCWWDEWCGGRDERRDQKTSPTAPPTKDQDYKHEGKGVPLDSQLVSWDLGTCYPRIIGFLLITSSPGITGSRIPRAPMKGF